jgi:hypothetical protein
MANRMVVILLIAFLMACKGGHKEEKQVQSKQKDVSEGLLSIDGKQLKGWEATNFGPQGPVYISGDEIILGMGDGCTGITWKGDFPGSDYEVDLEAMRVEGNDFFCGMTFPVGKDPCTLIVGGWGGTTVGLSNINGSDASENETTRLISFDKNKWYNIRLIVKGPVITAYIDTSKVVGINTTGKRLSIRPEVELSKPFGIASWRTTAAIRNIKVTSLKP